MISKRHFFLIILVGNTIFDILNVVDDTVFSFLRLFLIVFMFYHIIEKSKNEFKFDSASKSIIIFLLYILLLVPLSSKIGSTFTQYIAISLPLVGYIIAYNFFKTPQDFYFLKKTVFIVLLLYVLNAIFFNLTGLGPKVYEDDYNPSFLTGTLTHNKVYAGSLLFILTPLVLYMNKSKLFKIKYILISIGFLITVMITLRRTAILIILIGLIITLIFNQNKIGLFKGLIPLVGLLIITYPFYSDVLEKRLESRGKHVDINSRAEKGVEGEIRGREILSVTSLIFSFDDPIYSLFGKEIFNSPKTYDSRLFQFEPTRPLHSDYSTIIHGSGILGLILYINIFIQIIMRFIRLRKNRNIFENHLNVIFIAMFVNTLFISIPGRLNGISFRMVLLVLMGAIIGYFNYNLKNQINHVI